MHMRLTHYADPEINVVTLNDVRNTLGNALSKTLNEISCKTPSRHYDVLRARFRAGVGIYIHLMRT